MALARHRGIQCHVEQAIGRAFVSLTCLYQLKLCLACWGCSLGCSTDGAPSNGAAPSLETAAWPPEGLLVMTVTRLTLFLPYPGARYHVQPTL